MIVEEFSYSTFFIQLSISPLYMLSNSLCLCAFSYVVNFNISPDASCEPWRWDSSQMGIEEFTKPLGKPLGPPLRSGDTFSRHFEHLSVKVNIATEETEFIWKSE